MESFLSAVLRDRVTRGLEVGLIAAAATTGMLLGFGRAHGAMFRPLNAVAHVAIGSRALFFDRLYPSVTLLGLALLIAALLVWGILFAVIASTVRGLRLLIVATGFTLLVYFVNAGLLPPRLRPGFELTLSAAELAAVYIVLAVSFAAALALTRRVDDRI